MVRVGFTTPIVLSKRSSRNSRHRPRIATNVKACINCLTVMDEWFIGLSRREVGGNHFCVSYSPGRAAQLHPAMR